MTLKPCPFCGGIASASYIARLGMWVVGCSNHGCYADGPMANDEQSALALWNNRDERNKHTLAYRD